MTSRVERIADQWRADIARREQRVLDQVGTAYRQVMIELDRQLNALTTAIEQLAARGERVTSSMLWREQRLARLQRQALELFAQSGARASTLIEDAQLAAIRDGVRQADDLVAGLLEGAPPRITTALAGNLPAASFQAAVAQLQAGTPLVELLESISKNSVTNAINSLQNGIALGQNPRTIASTMRVDLTEPLWRAERIARTEVMRAHREGTADRYRDYVIEDQPLIGGWTWYAQVGSCCVACLAMHGTKHALDERLDGHPNCRCIMLPDVASAWAQFGVDSPDVATGQELVAQGDVDLSRFSPRMQAAIAAKPLDEFVLQRTDPVWGSMRSQRPLKDVLA